MTFHDDLQARVQELRPAVESVARAIHADPETADEEHRAVARLTDLFAGHGFGVDPGPGDPTSFVARSGSALSASTIGSSLAKSSRSTCCCVVEFLYLLLNFFLALPSVCVCPDSSLALF